MHVNGGFYMVRKKKLQEYEERIGEAMNVLGMVSEDTTTPRNIRRAAKQAISALQISENTPAVRAANAISILDEILQDPNMPPYTRVKLWNVMSLLEAIKD
jgi:uncharacterized protein (UPF0147 family)